MLFIAASLGFLSAWVSLRPTLAGRIAPERVASSTDAGSDVQRFVEHAAVRTTLCVLGLAGVGVLLQGWWGALVGVPVGIAMSRWIGTLEPPSVAKEREETARDLPLAVDLLAACANAGGSPDTSLRLVSGAVGGPLGARLDRLATRLELGADPLGEWQRLVGDDLLGPLARTMLRSLESGSPLADGLARLAEDRRRERRAQLQQRARSVGVKAAGPLAACFLPAFMLVGVIPTVAGSFARLII